MRHVLDTLGGLWELLLLAVRSRFRVRGRYWRWRAETAFGAEPKARPTRWRRARAALEYGRWVHRMKRGRWH
ncbi:MAG: hypothetical protein ACYTE6_16055 [Planctomycetota bacterium]|jgi:hypothetical protein